MQQTAALPLKSPGRFLLPLVLFLLLLTAAYLWLSYHSSRSFSLAAHLERSVSIEAPPGVYEAAVTYALKNLAVELDIDLKNYDLSQADYEAIVEAAATKFGDCHQYRLYALRPGPYPCYTCPSRPAVMLQKGQTFRIGQTCGTEKSRYASGLPEPGLYYLIEFRGNLFEVMVAEYVKLLLFQYSQERQLILNNNQLPVPEMPLPPGNKILR